ncbi:DCC1-like thiol-disulfide oxidoreductase family protein [Muricauda sp. 2012CJ35-5]|uniref:DCC1-like thiol-disulfide oxidoreductase family protein n=1 Tax=Flagellimonas spongiicola TaxID=2942208 RepID=A0ABT0PLV7_9FLAO|nr:DCC1-like thiol-disulfide oxidoreductase family protein [Allomuricauda spongiicola]MCL6272380.1 DCC1-like thiol-disulfide oxidoreductase family protein [Allomuricauda spongiicola]
MALDLVRPILQNQYAMERNVIVFDGECNLCNGVVGWLLAYAPNGQFQMIPFQSPMGKQLLQQNGYATNTLETVILFDEHGEHTLSDGFLRILSKIPQWAIIGSALALVPKVIRDNIYKLAAKNRVRWFGKSQTCAISI